MLGSCKLLRQMAQVSVQIDQDHTATAFHFEVGEREDACDKVSSDSCNQK